MNERNVAPLWTNNFKIWVKGFAIYLANHLDILYSIQSSSVQLLRRDRLSATPWTAARQASLSITSSRSSLRLNVHQVSDAIQPSHPLSSPSSSAPNPSQHQSLFQWVNLPLKRRNSDTCYNTDVSREHCIKWNKPITKRWIQEKKTAD